MAGCTRNEQGGFMILVEQHLLCKTTPSGAKQWRQYNLYVDAKGTQWFTKIFKGQSKRGLKLNLEDNYRCKENAKLDINNLVNNDENRGFIYKDRIVENLLDAPFSQFTPIQNELISFEEAKQKDFLNDNTHRLIRVEGGVHCCIKIGMDTAFHVEAKSNRNLSIPLPEHIEKKLRDMISISEFETFVLEAFVTASKVSLIDILCVNGMPYSKPLNQRFAMLAHLVNDDSFMQKCLKPSEVNLNAVKGSPYWYAVKPITGNEGDTDYKTSLIPQFFVFNVFPSATRDDILKYRDKKQRVNLFLSNDGNTQNALTKVGEIIVPLNYPLHKIKFVEAKAVVNGQLEKPRVSLYPYQSKRLMRSTMSQFDDLRKHWAGDLH